MLWRASASETRANYVKIRRDLGRLLLDMNVGQVDNTLAPACVGEGGAADSCSHDHDIESVRRAIHLYEVLHLAGSGLVWFGAVWNGVGSRPAFAVP